MSLSSISALSVGSALAADLWAVSEYLSTSPDDVSSFGCHVASCTSYVPGAGVVSAVAPMFTARQSRLTNSERELLAAAARIVRDDLERKAAEEQRLRSEQGKRGRAMKLEGDV